jgi:hypothetical protein
VFAQVGAADGIFFFFFDFIPPAEPAFFGCVVVVIIIRALLFFFVIAVASHRWSQARNGRPNLLLQKIAISQMGHVELFF